MFVLAFLLAKQKRFQMLICYRFGSPSHRLETQIQATAKVLEINCQVVYLPGTMLVSFGDDATHTSETKFLKQSTGLDLGKLQATHHLYWNVVHDKMSVDQASKDLDVLMTTPVYYTWWQTLIIGAFCSAFITVLSFYGRVSSLSARYQSEYLLTMLQFFRRCPYVCGTRCYTSRCSNACGPK